MLGGGCFWCTEAVFLRVDGVTRVVPGYAGGDVLGPTYEHVWFQTPVADLYGPLIDSLVAWGLTGIWLGWWLNKGK